VAVKSRRKPKGVPVMAQIASLEDLRRRIPEPNKVTKLKVLDHLDEQARAFVATSPFLLLSTVDAEGLVEVSPKGDERGFVRIEDERTLVIPDRAGNNLAFGLMNILANPNVGMIFLAPGTGETLRVSGRATIHDDEALLQSLSARGKPAKLAMRVAVKHAYFHCARSVLRAGLWETGTWPQPPLKVSFGKIFQTIMKTDASVVPQIDADVHAAYRPENL
jgi:PPOX class probable FMN-dependent enzyme